MLSYLAFATVHLVLFSCMLLTKKPISYYRSFGGIPHKYFFGTCTYTYKYLSTFILKYLYLYLSTFVRHVLVLVLK